MNLEPADPSELSIQNRDQAEAAGAIVAALHIQIKTAQAKSDRVSLAAQKLTSRISQLRGRLVRYEAALKQWAEKNRAEMGEQKSLVMRHVTIAFRNAGRSVRFLEGWELARVLAKLRTMPKLKKSYIRIKEELNRQQILSDSRPEVGKLDAKTMRGFGLEVSAEEYFYVEPKFESSQAPQ